MTDKQQLATQRYGGHLILIVLALALLVVMRVMTAGAVDGDDGETVVSTNANDSADDSEMSSSPDDPSEPITHTEELPIIEDTSLSPALNPYTYQPKLPEHTFQIYTVQRGDTPNKIAESFGIQPETLLGGNPFLSEESNLLQSNAELIILPVDGLLHDVAPGDTLEGLAAQYGVSEEEIIAYAPNNLEFPFRLQPETQILVPGAVREVFVWEPPTLATVNSNTSGGIRPVVQGTGTFVWPIVSRNFTQYFWYGHRAIDVAASEGSTTVASDTGTVTFAGWNNYGYGNLIVVNHGNGYETFYAHLSGINVVPGQVVTQGQYIGATGNTGNSSGPHIHFEVRWNGNQDDPCFYISC
jgi:murein DD-endopeptidase MepM/ murein hydrolase activator NlpD